MQLLAEFGAAESILARMQDLSRAGAAKDHFRVDGDFCHNPVSDFFMGKGGFLEKRIVALVSEMERRGFKFKEYSVKDSVNGIYTEWMSDWYPSQEDLSVAFSIYRN